MAKKLIGVGHAVIDFFCEVADEEKIKTLGLIKGTMNLVDAKRWMELSELFPMVFTSPGGSVCNTLDTLAQLGLNCTFIAGIGKDMLAPQLTSLFQQLKFDTQLITAIENSNTSRSLILITPDGQRTMCTMLGASSKLSATHVPMSIFLNADAVIVEGYLLDSPNTAEAAIRALNIRRSQKIFGTLTLCDQNLVKRHRKIFRHHLEHCPLIVGNLLEFKALLEVDSVEEVVSAVRESPQVHCITRSSEGAIITKDNKVIEIPAYTPKNVIDTTGAGDQFLAGLLFGMLRDMNLTVCGRIGAMMGGSIVEQISASFHRDIKDILSRLKKFG